MFSNNSDCAAVLAVMKGKPQAFQTMLFQENTLEQKQFKVLGIPSDPKGAP